MDQRSGEDDGDPPAADYAVARQRMIDGFDSGPGRDAITDERVREAVGAVPRHQFVPRSQRAHAYEDRPLPIGHGVTISQPYIVALMTQLLDVDEGMSVLEIGTGSGYQAAVLAELGARVYSIEIIEPLGVEAAERLDRTGYDVDIRVGDGYAGWPEHAPFDRIILTAAPPQVPEPLLEQLAPGGRLVAPVGRSFGVQSLQVIDKDEDGELHERDALPVRFVPMTGQAQED